MRYPHTVHAYTIPLTLNFTLYLHISLRTSIPHALSPHPVCHVPPPPHPHSQNNNINTSTLDCPSLVCECNYVHPVKQATIRWTTLIPAHSHRSDWKRAVIQTLYLRGPYLAQYYKSPSNVGSPSNLIANFT